MKRLLIILTFFHLIYFANGQTDIKLLKTEREYLFQVHKGKLDTVGILKTLRKYKKKGKMILEVDYYTFSSYYTTNLNSFRKKNEYIYNSNGLLVERNLYNEKDSLPWSMRTYSYKLNKQGLPLEKTILTKVSFDRHISFSTEKEIEIYKYDRQGNKIKKTSKNIYPDYTFSFVRTFKYDDKGNLIEVDLLHDGRKTIRKYQFDQQGNCIKYKIEGRTRSDIKYWEKKYDEKGNLIEHLTCTAAKKYWTKKFFYNGNNQKVKEIHKTSDRVVSTIYDLEYNDSGLLIKKSVYFPTKEDLHEIIKFEYEYFN